MWYTVSYELCGKARSRRVSWIHLPALVAWITGTAGCELLHVEAIETEEEETP